MSAQDLQEAMGELLDALLPWPAGVELRVELARSPVRTPSAALVLMTARVVLNAIDGARLTRGAAASTAVTR